MSASDSALPLDIRLMNAAATLLFALVALAVLAAALQWLSRTPARPSMVGRMPIRGGVLSKTLFISLFLPLF